MSSNWIVIGIGGATSSGKTTVAKELHAKLPGSVLIHQDDFFFKIGSPQLEYVEELQHYNWDVITAIDTEQLVKKVQDVMSTEMSGRKTLIIDGHFIYAFPEIATVCTKKYFFVVPKEIARYRRRTRKYKRHDDRYFDKYAWPLFEEYKSRTLGTYEDVTVVDGELELASIVDTILGDVAPHPPCSAEAARTS